METQETTLQKEIKHLEQALENSVYNGNAFEQIHIHKRLDIARSTLLNIK